MTDEQFADSLRRLRPAHGPTPESVAFRAGNLDASRRLRRRFAPVLILLAMMTVGGWGVAGWLLARPSSPVAVPTPTPLPEPQPDPGVYPVPEAWRERFDLLDRLGDEGLDALGPPDPPGPAVVFPLPTLENY